MPEPTPPEIVVTGNRYQYNGSVFSPGGGSGPLSSEPYTDSHVNEPTPPDRDCADTSQLAPEELRDYRISQEAAKVADEIRAQPNRDHHEFASLIWEDANGAMHHTPVNEGSGPLSSVSYNGLPNPGTIVALIHSHAPDAGVGSGREFPTREDPAGRSDWGAYDSIAQDIANSLVYDHGLSINSYEYDSRMLEFRQYILAPTGPSGSNAFVLRGFNTLRRGNELDRPGQKISLDLARCP